MNMKQIVKNRKQHSRNMQNMQPTKAQDSLRIHEIG